MFCREVQNVFEVVQVDVLSYKGKVLLIEKDLQLHKSCIFIPDSFVDFRFNSIVNRKRVLVFNLQRLRNNLGRSLKRNRIDSFVKKQVSISAPFKEAVVVD